MNNNEDIPLKENVHVETDEYIPFEDFSSGLMEDPKEQMVEMEEDHSIGYMEDVDLSIHVNGRTDGSE